MPFILISDRTRRLVQHDAVNEIAAQLTEVELERYGPSGGRTALFSESLGCARVIAMSV